MRSYRRLRPALAGLAVALMIGGIAAPSAAAVPSTNVFPVQGYGISACSDSFGDPRSGGRTHQGNDCFAPVGTPLRAVESGVILEADNVDSHACGSSSGDLGGITLWLAGDSGTAYYYAHNSRNTVTTGERVTRGQVIGAVGDTGNACSTPPHLHFEIHPGGRGTPAIDPYPHLSTWSNNSGPLLPRRPVCYAVAGDWNGDGTDTLGAACRDGNTYQWDLMNTNSGGTPAVSGRYGNSDTCLPVTGDWNGDGQDTIGVACKAGNSIRWSLVNAFRGSPSYPEFTFGNSNDCWPRTGDWNGDGTDTIAVACKAGNGIHWSMMNIHAGGSPQGTGDYAASSACHPVDGDWNGDGVTTVGASCRTGNSIQWSLVNASRGSPSYPEFTFGNNNACQPVTGDWNGNGTTTIGIACAGHQLSWGLMNIHDGGSPQVTANFGNGNTYQPTAGWGGPPWPTWPNV